MKKLKILIISLFFLMFQSTVESFASRSGGYALEKDYLEVPEHVFSLQSRLNEYLLKVQKVLISGVPRGPYVQMVVIPSLKPEWMVNIFEPKGKKSLVVYTVMEQQIWGNDQWANLRAVRFMAEIPKEMAEAIRDIVVRKLHGVKYPEGGGTLSDEHLYYFLAYIDGEGILTGKKMLMDPKTETGELISVGMLIKEYILADEDERASFLVEIQKSIKKLK